MLSQVTITPEAVIMLHRNCSTTTPALVRLIFGRAAEICEENGWTEITTTMVEEALLDCTPF